MPEAVLANEFFTVAIVGAGTAGLALAAELKRLQVGKVIVLERDAVAGGIPRHCGHYPFGIHEYKRLMKGPEYARRNTHIAIECGAEVRTGTTVIALRPNGILEVSGSEKCYVIQADRVVLCTGVRESSRAQRFISGDRPGGIMTTGALQSLVYLKGIRPFARPVIFGSELVSYSAIHTCAHLGIKPVAMVEEHQQTIARRFFQPYLLTKRIALYTGIENPCIKGGETVEAFQFNDASGQLHSIDTDGIIVSGRFRPESGLLRLSHLEVDPNTGGPVMDQFHRCSDPAYYCAGNIIRSAETSAYCWQEGISTARCIADDLLRGPVRISQSVPIVSSEPAIQFVVPQRFCLTSSPGGERYVYLGLNKAVDSLITVGTQDRSLWQGKLKSQPVRRIRIPIPEIDLSNPPSEIRLSIQNRE